MAAALHVTKTRSGFTSVLRICKAWLSSRKKPLLSALIIACVGLVLKRAKFRKLFGWLFSHWERTSAKTCVLCGGDFEKEKYAHFALPADLCKRRCHLWCVMRKGSSSGSESENVLAPLVGKAAAVEICGVLRGLTKECPQLHTQQNSCIRLSCEENRLVDPMLIGNPSPPPPPIAFAFAGVREIRISSCALRSLPREIGEMRELQSLVLMSLELTELPDEVGKLKELTQIFLNGNFLHSLPKSIGALPALEDLCFDANQLRAVPAFASLHLRMFTAPGNLLQQPPRFARVPERLEVHGNFLATLPTSESWSELKMLKAMGNRLTALPREIAATARGLCMLNLADNCLVSLPEEISTLQSLEYLSVYNNQLTSLPHNLLRGTRLKQLLVEGNGLTSESLDELLADASRSRQVQTLAIDDHQAETLWLHGKQVSAALPTCFTVGSLVRVKGSGNSNGMYLKLARASQLRRAAGVSVAGGPGGPAPASLEPAKILVVAFAASQGEPEWLGLLRTLAGTGRASSAARRFPPPEASLESYLGKEISATDDTRWLPLWDSNQGNSLEETAEVDGSADIDLPDFDVLCVCDARMRWYAEDAEDLGCALEGVCKRYEKRLFIGASMGGFGSMLHGGRLADTVLAFGPQSLLHTATLRPPAADASALQAHFARVSSAVSEAHRRGARVEIHCAADVHLENALALPLADMELTVHALIPRVPFAKLLDRVGVLWPIVAKSIADLLKAGMPNGSSCTVHSDDAQSQLPGVPAPRRVCVARWVQDGCLRYWSSREELSSFLFGFEAPALPRPGDWFCSQCCSRNTKTRFFCKVCANKSPPGDGCSDAPALIDPGTCFVPDRGYPRQGDWGCGSCGSAMQARDSKCSQCRSSWDDPRHVFVEQ